MMVLIIEDDQDIAQLVAYNLGQEQIRSTLCHNGKDGLVSARETHPDLIILDVMLPDMSGVTVCKNLKADSNTKKIPILMLTAKGEEIDRIVGFEVGADDYVTKPFSPRELILRVKAILHRTQAEPSSDKEVISFGPLKVDPKRLKVTLESKELKLTSTEFKLIQYLLEHKGEAVSRDQLLGHVWGYEAPLATRTVDTHIKRVREKLETAGDYIETLHGTGYRFKETP